MIPEKIECEYPEIFHPFFAEPKRYNVAEGGRGRGASWTIARKLLIEASRSRQRVLCTREYQNSIRDSVHRLLVDQIYALHLEDFFTIFKDSIICPIFRSEFIFKGLHTAIQEIKSLEGITRCWVEEAEAVSEYSWTVLIPTIRAQGSQFYVSYNSESENSATYIRFHKNPPPDSNIVFSTYADNPWFPETLRREMEYDKRVDYEKYEHVWLGLPKTYGEALIMRGKIKVEAFETPPDAQLLFGADFGFSVDPTVLLRCFIKGTKLFIDYEAYGHGIELMELENFFLTVPESRRTLGGPKWEIRADSARPETISLLKRQGFNIVGAEKGKGSVEDGIQFLRSFEEVIIHPRCKGTISDFKNWRWKQDRITGRVIPIPAEGSDHSPDACLKGDSMIITESGEKAIKDIKVGEKVLTRAGFKRVEWSGASRKNAEVLEIKTESGKAITCTPDHKIWTKDGFIRADAVRYGHELLTVSAGKSSSSTNSRKSRLVADRVLTVSVLSEKEPEVYDLTVKDQPEFFANGILVHNCRYALERYMKKKTTIYDALARKS